MDIMINKSEKRITKEDHDKISDEFDNEQAILSIPYCKIIIIGTGGAGNNIISKINDPDIYRG